MPFVCPEITCNLQWRNATRQLAYAKQGEYNSRKIAVQLYDGANRFTFTPGTYVGEFAYRRPDGAGRAYSTIDDAAAVELDGTTGTAVITLEPEVLGVAGIVECELRLKTSGSLLATFTFGYYVEQAVVTADTPSPSPDPGPTPTPTGEKTKFFGFVTMTAYNQFVAQNPGVLVDGDIVVIKSVNGSNIVHTFYVLVGTQLTSRHVITVGSDSGGASSLPALGGGYGVCSSLKNTVAKIVRIDGFVRTANVPFQVKFNYDVQSGDTLNVRSSSSSSSGTGACTLRWNGDNVPVGLIVAGCTATLVYDGTYYQVLSVDPVTAPMIADGAITAEKVAAGVIPGWYYYASTSAYNTDAANVPNGSYVLIGTTQIILYRKAAGSLSQICAWPTGGGGNVDNVVIVPIENNQAQLTPYIIYNAGYNIMFYLYDQVTHALARLHKRPITASDETATFIWEDTDNRQFVLYSLPAGTSTGITKSYVAFDQGGGDGSTTLPELGGGYATASGGSTVAQSVTITGFVRTTGNGPTVKFTSELTAKSPTLNINDGTDDTGAAAIWYCGSTLKPGTIRSGALVKFVFDGTHYCVESIDERPVIQLVPNNGVVSISGTYQDLIAKLKGAAVPQIICLSPNASAQNMEILELRHVWSNDTTSEIKLAGRLGGIEYYVVLSQSGSSGSEVMSGTLESANITPDVIMQNSLQPTIAIHNNELHDCGTVTRIYISSWPADGDWGLEFSSSSPATELVWAGNHPTWPDGMTSFVPKANTQYEINVHNGKALIGAWPV